MFYLFLFYIYIFFPRESAEHSVLVLFVILSFRDFVGMISLR